MKSQEMILGLPSDAEQEAALAKALIQLLNLTVRDLTDLVQKLLVSDGGTQLQVASMFAEIRRISNKTPTGVAVSASLYFALEQLTSMCALLDLQGRSVASGRQRQACASAGR